MDLKEVGWENADWIIPDEGRNKWRAVVSAVLNLRFP